MTATRAQIAEEARTWIDVPYVHQGYSKTWGCDCIGFVRAVGEEAGALDPSTTERVAARYSGYSRETNQKRMGAALEEFLVCIPKDTATTGDILWIKIAKSPRHLGIITEPGIVIHSDLLNGRVIEHGIDSSRVSVVIAAYKYPDIEEVQ